MKTTKLLALFGALLLTSAEFIAIDHLFTHAPGHPETAERLAALLPHAQSSGAAKTLAS